MKKILPILSLLGASALIVGMGVSPNTAQEKKESYINNINAFKNEVTKYTSVNDVKLASTSLNKYTLSLEENLDELINQEITTVNENNEVFPENEQEENLSNEFAENELTDLNEYDDNNIIENDTISNYEEISTLYSLSNDIENSCDEFCDLKEDITNAIIETQDLIHKVQQNEINLTDEQRMFITEQAQQLKNLGRKLSNVTTELSFNLSDLSQYMSTSTRDINNLSLKYLVVLDNLVNGNEMLQSGLTSLNMINQMFNMNTKDIPSNNQGRVLYGFQHNNNPPIIKDYFIDENGEIIENNLSNTENKIDASDNSIEVENNISNTTVDTYKERRLNSNLDTYNNNNLPNNIDTFFNTALLDNEFMYGNNQYGYGMNGMYNVNNPYRNINNTTNGIDNNNNTQDNEINKINNSSQKEKKRLKLKKNIDTFKDENTPDIKTKLGSIKNSITSFFNKFKKADIRDNVENPIYRFNAKDIKNSNS